MAGLGPNAGKPQVNSEERFTHGIKKKDGYLADGELLPLAQNGSRIGRTANFGRRPILQHHERCCSLLWSFYKELDSFP